MKTFMLRALWMVGLVLALACGGSNGGDDPTTDTGQPPGDSTTPPEDMTIPPVECDPVCAEGEVCNNGTCEAAPPAECEPACKPDEQCIDGVCEIAGPPPFICIPPCEDNETCEFGECVASLSWSDVFNDVLIKNNCHYCHGSGGNLNPGGGLFLIDEAIAYSSMVGANAAVVGCGMTQLVVPGSPEQSILWDRIKPLADGVERCLPTMPMNDGDLGLPEADAQQVYDWILGGALP